MIGVRLSAFDWLPGSPGFGWDGRAIDLTEPIAFIKMLNRLDVRLINVTGGSPYYSPHVQRPAIFPPSDGYAPPEDPLVGVARQIEITRQIKQACPDSIIVGSGYTYLQEYLPHVAQAVVRNGWTDFVGVGRLVLSYWDMPADTLAGRIMQVKRICRTFSDCTSAPRNGLISGCYPLDEHYKNLPENDLLKQKKAELRRKLGILK
jgi:2,4-dienoyl-CoA reductase-like NADH-dependent reductase (Old Yellow Enzyme family)